MQEITDAYRIEIIYFRSNLRPFFFIIIILTQQGDQRRAFVRNNCVMPEGEGGAP